MTEDLPLHSVMPQEADGALQGVLMGWAALGSLLCTCVAEQTVPSQLWKLIQFWGRSSDWPSLFSAAGAFGQQQYSSWQNPTDGYLLPDSYLPWWGMVKCILALCLHSSSCQANKVTVSTKQTACKAYASRTTSHTLPVVRHKNPTGVAKDVFCSEQQLSC